MNCQNKFKNKRQLGFTLIEFLIVISIIIIILSISFSSFDFFKSNNDLKINANTTIEAIRLAQLNAIYNKENSDWGIKILENKVIIFKGNNYEDRDASFDEFFSLSNGINTDGLSLIVFKKISGESLNTGDIILIGKNDEIINLNINEKGTIIY